MIDVQTYRQRIGGASALMNKILQRKAAKLTAWRGESHHKDEDLIRKRLKTLTLTQFSYVMLILLVILFAVSKSTVFKSHIQTQLVCSIFTGHFTLIHDRADAFLSETALAVCCSALCLSNIGAVHFIAILLLMAGVEPNPGPTGETENSKSDEKSSPTDDGRCDASVVAQNESTTAATNIHPTNTQPGATPCVHPEGLNLKDAEAQCDIDEADDGAASSKTTYRTPNYRPTGAVAASHDADLTTLMRPKKKNVFTTFLKKIPKPSRSNSLNVPEHSFLDTSRAAEDFIPEMADDIFTEETIHLIFIKKEDNTVILSVPNMDINQENFELIIDKIDLPNYNVSEIDLSGSTFCSMPWSEHPDGFANLKRLLSHSKLRYSLKTINLDMVVFSAHSSGGLLVSLKHKKLASHDLNLLHKLLTSVMTHFDVSYVDVHSSGISGASWGSLPDGPQLLDDLLRHPRLQGVSMIELENIGLTRTPDAIAGSLHHCLTDLNVSNNRLTTVDGSLVSCKFLLKLNLSENRLVALPDPFHFPNLLVFNIENNPVYEIPNMQLPSLKKLIIGAPETRTIHRKFVEHYVRVKCDIQVNKDNVDELKAPTFNQLKKNPGKYMEGYDSGVEQLKRIVLVVLFR